MSGMGGTKTGASRFRQKRTSSARNNIDIAHRHQHEHDKDQHDHHHHHEPNQFVIFMIFNLVVGAFAYAIYRFLGFATEK